MGMYEITNDCKIQYQNPIVIRMCHYSEDLLVCICINLLPVYLFIFQLHLLFLLLPCLWWIKIFNIF